MSSFIEKLKKMKLKRSGNGSDLKSSEEKEKISQVPEEGSIDMTEDLVQLDVDICQTNSEIIIYAMMAGVSSENLSIVLNDDNDILTIKGKRVRPECGSSEEGKKEKWLLEEGKWGNFFRRIILPQEVDPAKVQAKLKSGLLILKLPLASKGIFSKKISILEED